MLSGPKDVRPTHRADEPDSLKRMRVDCRLPTTGRRSGHVLALAAASTSSTSGLRHACVKDSAVYEQGQKMWLCQCHDEVHTTQHQMPLSEQAGRTYELPLLHTVACLTQLET